MSTLGVWITLKWRGEQPEVAEKIDQVAEIIWEQVNLEIMFSVVGINKKYLREKLWSSFWRALNCNASVGNYVRSEFDDLISIV